MATARRGSVRSVLIFVGAIGIASIGAGLWALVQCLQIRQSWKAVEAVSIRADVVSDRQETREHFRGEVEFRYSVDGREFQTPYSFRTSTTERGHVEHSLAAYAPQTVHTIYHAPDDPNDIALEISGLGFYVLPVAFIGTGLMVLPVVAVLWRILRPVACAQCGTGAAPEHRYCSRCGTELALSRLRAHGRSGIRAARIARTGGAGRDPRTLYRILAAFFGLPGLACLAVAAPSALRSREIIHDWPAVEASVVASEVVRHHDIDGRLQFRVQVTFQYQAAGGDHIVTSESPFQSGDYAWSERRRAEYPPGRKHVIHYNPEDPEDIRFSADGGWLFWLPAIALGVIGAVFGAIGAGLLVSSLRPRCPSCFSVIVSDHVFCPFCKSSLRALEESSP